jgi:hypothetical protein
VSTFYFLLSDLVLLPCYIKNNIGGGGDGGGGGGGGVGAGGGSITVSRSSSSSSRVDVVWLLLIF